MPSLIYSLLFITSFNIVASFDPQDEDNAIQKACDDAPLINRGLNGDIHGPGQYKGKQCAYERIRFTEDQRTLSNEDEMTAVEKVCNNGRQWMNFDHPNLIKIVNVILHTPAAVYIVMEYPAGRSVRRALGKVLESKEDLPIEVVKDWAKQIAKGMEYLHQKGIVHRNIRSAQSKFIFS